MSPWRLLRRGTCAAGIAVAVYGVALRPWHLRWGATEDEVRRTLPGDELVATPMVAATRAITIECPPDEVWPWLVQQGYGRAGWYAYRIDNAWRPSPDYVVPEWQHLAVGDVLQTDARSGFTVTELESNHYWVGVIDGERGRISAVQYLEPRADGTTRLVQRVRAYFAPTLGALAFWVAFDLGDFVFMRKQLLGIKRRAEAAATREDLVPGGGGERTRMSRSFRR